MSNRWFSLAAVCLGMMLSFLNITATISALASLQQDLQISNATLVWIPSIYALVVAALVLSTGTIGDVYGRRRAFVAGTAVMAVGSVLTATAGSGSWVIVAQAVTGVGGALVLPNSLAIVSHLFPDPRERTEAITVWAACSGLGLALGPLSAGAILLAFSWSIIFLVNSIAAALVTVVVMVVVRKGSSGSARLDWYGLVSGTVAIAAFTYWVIDGSHNGFFSKSALSAITLAAVGIATFFTVEVRSDHPMLDLRLFRSASFSAVMLVAATAMFGFTGIALISVLLLQKVDGLTAWSAGLHLLAMMGTYVLASAVAPKVLARIGFKIPLTAGLVLVSLGAIMLLRVRADSGSIEITTGLIVVGVGFGFLIAPSTAAAMISVEPQRAGMASAAVNMVRQLGGVLGSSVLGSVLTAKFASELPGRLAERGVPGPIADVTAAGAANGAVSPVVEFTDQISGAVAEAFTAAYRSGITIAAVTFAIVAVIAAVFVTSRPTHTSKKETSHDVSTHHRSIVGNRTSDSDRVR
ncbi:MFS transporter [Rhodococcus sp. WS4]|nr:MFS transporter [Rhodococcus sp. WS4]